MLFLLFCLGFIRIFGDIHWPISNHRTQVPWRDNSGKTQSIAAHDDPDRWNPDIPLAFKRIFAVRADPESKCEFSVFPILTIVVDDRFVPACLSHSSNSIRMMR